MDFEESLPSHSTFLNQETGNRTVTGSWTQETNDINGRRSPSPPPPPPPLPVSAPEEVNTRDRPQEQRRVTEGESNKPSDNRKFPFLRKNSRKEPSALHRVNSPTKSPSSPSPTSADSSGFTGSTEKAEPTARPSEPSKYQFSNTTGAAGSAQRPIPVSIATLPAQRPVPMSTARDCLEETDYSTISITGDNWRKQQTAHANELAEFEQIERQVQLGSSLALSGSQSINTVTLQQARRPAPQPSINELDESVDSGGWDMPEDLGASQRSTIRVRSDDDAVRWQDTGAHSAVTYIGEQYGDDDPLLSSYQDATQYASRSSPARSHRSSDEEHDARSPPAAPGTTTVNIDAGDYGQTLSSAYRTVDSPSWGKVTQPADTSFDSDSEYPPEAGLSNSRGASLSSTTTPGAGARMSESTLRKISSRTAALHHNTRPTIERPTLADDTMSHIDARLAEHSVSTSGSSVRPGSVTRPLSTQRRLANTLAGSAPHGANNRSRSAGRGSSRTGGTVATAAEFTHDMHVLEAKAKELEDEIQAYRSKNAALDKLHKQQKAALAEVVGQKDEVLRWAAEEKLRTQKYCEEQQAAAHKERNSVAKLAREIRQKASATPIRKEKAEVEALQATIEKMKLEHEQAIKKHKLNEQRLTSNNAAQAAHIVELDRQILAIDEDNLRLREFIQKEGILLPKHLRIAPQRAGSTSSPKAATSRGFGGSGNGSGSGGKGRQHPYYSEEGYVEEVDVDVVENVSSSRHYAEGGAAAATAAAPARTSYALSTTLGLPKKSNTVLSSTSRPGSGTGKAGGMTGDVFTQQSSNLRSSSAARASRASAPGGARDSWARSSRSSRSSAGGRYDDWEASDRDDSFIGTGDSATKQATSSVSKLSGAPVQNEEPIVAPGSGSAGSGRTEEDLPDGGKVIRYKNGTEKRVDKAGNSVVNFLNGDTKTVNVVTGSVVYFYAEAKTTHTTYGDGLEVYEFPNGQVEMQFPDGIKEIVFPDNTRKVIHPDGLQESHFPDGVLLREHPDGRREVLSKDDADSMMHH